MCTKTVTWLQWEHGDWSDNVEWNVTSGSYSLQYQVNDTNDNNVSIILTLRPVCNTNSCWSADCPPGVTITGITGDSPYEAGHVLTCSADGNNPTYLWEGINGGTSVSSTTSSTVTLLEGEFCLICTATVDPREPECSASDFLCGSARGKYQKQHNIVHEPDQTLISPVGSWSHSPLCLWEVYSFITEKTLKQRFYLQLESRK